MRERYTRLCADRAHELASAASRIEQWEAVIEPSIPEGPALLGFVAARIAEEASGPEAYHAERARQTEWLVEQLGSGAGSAVNGPQDLGLDLHRMTCATAGSGHGEPRQPITKFDPVDGDVFGVAGLLACTRRGRSRPS